MGDAIRWANIIMCLFNLGVMIALFERVGRWFIPKIPMRLLAAGYGLALIALAGGSRARLGEALTWRTPVSAVALFLQCVGLVMMYRWYETPEGKAHSEKMARE